jgi:hypothetical protein
MSILATLGPADSTGSAAANDTTFSGATNWETTANSYQIQLYCSNDQSYSSPSLAP